MIRKIQLLFLLLNYLQFGTFRCGETEQTRSLIEFSNMIGKVTGRNSFSFCGYGKFCGSGGKGHPVDAIDRCCQVHDDCYGYADSCFPKLRVYNFVASLGSATCLDSATSCEYKVCMCDKVASECFYKNLASYNSNYQSLSSCVWGVGK
jgi:secretory phospholipase A2